MTTFMVYNLTRNESYFRSALNCFPTRITIESILKSDGENKNKSSKISFFGILKSKVKPSPTPLQSIQYLLIYVLLSIINVTLLFRSHIQTLEIKYQNQPRRAWGRRRPIRDMLETTGVTKHNFNFSFCESTFGWMSAQSAPDLTDKSVGYAPQAFFIFK